jgi:hypothetical protein
LAQDQESRQPGDAAGTGRLDPVALKSSEPFEPMTLGNIRELGVRSLAVSCWQCHHQAVLGADRWPDDVAAPTFGPVCTSCGIVGADTRPNWKEQPARESLTGVQWRS